MVQPHGSTPVLLNPYEAPCSQALITHVGPLKESPPSSVHPPHLWRFASPWLSSTSQPRTCQLTPGAGTWGTSGLWRTSLTMDSTGSKNTHSRAVGQAILKCYQTGNIQRRSDWIKNTYLQKREPLYAHNSHPPSPLCRDLVDVSCSFWLRAHDRKGEEMAL